MAKRMGRHPDRALTFKQVQHAGPGFHPDGGGLYLRVTRTGAKSWILRTVVQRKRRDIGLGSLSLVSLAEAREEARRLRRIARDGRDPLEQRRAERRVVPTFAEAAEVVHRERREAWKEDGKHGDQWIGTLRTYAFPQIGDVQVSEVTPGQVRDVLSPIWQTKAETARRLKQRISAVMDWAIVSGHRVVANPVSGIERGLGRQRRDDGHHEALPYDEVPAFVARLRDSNRPSIGRLAFEFLILTACRTGEVLAATWSEIDLDAATWSIPADRMKAARPHVVPLVPRAVEILRQVQARQGGRRELVFESSPGKPFSNGVFLATMRRMQVDATPHGCRSSFRDWVAEQTDFPRELAEKALAHTLTSKTEAAYQRGDLLEKRRDLMLAWSAYVEPADEEQPADRPAAR